MDLSRDASIRPPADAPRGLRRHVVSRMGGRGTAHLRPTASERCS